MMRFIADKKGVSAVMVALLLMVVFVLLAIVVDVSNALLVKHQLQAVADAGSLAGASVFELATEIDNGEFVTKIKVLPEARDEAESVILLNCENFNFSRRNIVLKDFDGRPFLDDGIGTSAYEVKLRASFPTLLLHLVYPSGRHGFELNVVSEAEVILVR